MAGALLSLQARGISDIYFTQKPQINFFNYVMYRYVNFASETLDINLSNFANFGTKQISAVIPKKGHLLSKLYLRLQLPRLEPRDGTYSCWSDSIGYSIFNGPIELLIGGVVVDRLFPECLDFLSELNNTYRNLNQLILKSDTYRANLYNAEREIDLMIPLDFWFCKNYGSALPLISLNNQEISIQFSLKEFNKVINYDGNLEPYPVNILDSNLYAEYIYLDDIVLDSFAKKKHQYIIEQQFYHGDEIVNINQPTLITKINFQNPCKELLFAMVDSRNIENNNYFNYSNPDTAGPFISHISLLLDGRERFNNGPLPEHIFRVYYPYNLHPNVPTKHIYAMPFCLKPDDHSQPTGSLNMAKFDEINLSLKLNKNETSSSRIYIYGIMYNVVTVINGSLVFELMTQ